MMAVGVGEEEGGERGVGLQGVEYCDEGPVAEGRVGEDVGDHREGCPEDRVGEGGEEGALPGAEGRGGFDGGLEGEGGEPDGEEEGGGEGHIVVEGVAEGEAEGEGGEPAEEEDGVVEGEGAEPG